MTTFTTISDIKRYASDAVANWQGDYEGNISAMITAIFEMKNERKLIYPFDIEDFTDAERERVHNRAVELQPEV